MKEGLASGLVRPQEDRKSDWAAGCQVFVASPAKAGEGKRIENMALHFELVTPEKLVRAADVWQVVVPGTDGDFGVLEGHAPFMSTVRDGSIQIYASAGATPEIIPVQGGFAEVNEKGLTVLAEKAG